MTKSKINIMKFSTLDQKNVIECRNLSCDEDGSLVPVPNPGNVAIPAGYTPVAHIRGRIIALKGSELAVIIRGLPGTPLTLPETPARVSLFGERLLIEMSDGYQMLAGPDLESGTLISYGERAGRRQIYETPQLSFYSEGKCSAEIAAVALSKQWTERRVLSPSDIAHLRSAARQATEALDNESRRKGLLIHPMLFIVRIRDRDGRLIYESEPSLFRVPQSDALPMRVQLSENTTSGTSDPMVISTDAYKVMYEYGREWGETYAGGSFEVLCSPAFPVFDPSGTHAVTGRQRAQDHYLCNVAFAAGDAARMDDFSELDVQSFLHLADADNIPWVKVYASRLRPSTVSGTFGVRPGRVIKASELLPRSSDEVHAVYPSVQHTFTAAAGAVAGDIALRADLKVRRAPVATFRTFVKPGTSGTGLWHGYVAVEFGDGSLLVETASGNDGCPTGVRPMIGYPAPDAVSLTIAWWNPAAGHFYGRFPLVCDGSGRRSVYIHPSGTDFLLQRTAEKFAVPEPEDPVLTFPDRLVATPADDPQLPLACGTIPAGKIICVQPLAGATGAWDYGRRKFLIFTTAGVYTVTVDRNGRSMSVGLTDRRIIGSELDTVALPRGVAAVAEDELVIFEGGQARCAATGVRGCRPVWCAERGGEIWLVGGAETLVVPYGMDGVAYTIGLSLEKTGYAPWLHGADEWYLPAHDSGAPMIEVCWKGIIGTERLAPGQLRRMEFTARGTFSDVAVSLSRSFLGAEAPAPELRMIVNGRMAIGLRRPFLCPPCREFVAEVKGKVSVKSVFDSINIR